MKKIVITENQKGFLFKNGKYVKLLGAGKYILFGGKEIAVSEIDGEIYCKNCPLETLLADENIAKRASFVEVGDEELALHYVDGKFQSSLCRGKYAFWNDAGEHEFKIIDISTPYVQDDVPKYIFDKLPMNSFKKIEVGEHQKARLCIGKRFEKILDAGTYYFWYTPAKIDVDFIDTRLTKMDVTGQEILTADKVTLRINFVLTYRVTDYVKIFTEIENYEEQIYTAAQLALREYVGKCKLDEILENKEGISDFVFEKLKAKEKAFFVEFKEAGVKDIILPGEIREIMNTVLVAEKRAQANVITRREEVASTRSLLNTAKLMDENETLYKLKELEYIERICENVGNININGGDILSQLTGILHPQK
ncbi:MAG: slipin family protein [Ruminococcaceae bacterium]|nr:slipin family protein [Oscillospiraceae bacterium]